MITALFTMIVYLLILGLLYWLLIYIIDNVPIPDPPARIIKIAAMAIMVLVIIVLLLDLLGGGVSGLDLPKLGVGQ